MSCSPLALVFSTGLGRQASICYSRLASLKNITGPNGTTTWWLYDISSFSLLCSSVRYIHRSESDQNSTLRLPASLYPLVSESHVVVQLGHYSTFTLTLYLRIDTCDLIMHNGILL